MHPLIYSHAECVWVRGNNVSGENREWAAWSTTGRKKGDQNRSVWTVDTRVSSLAREDRARKCDRSEPRHHGRFLKRLQFFQLHFDVKIAAKLFCSHIAKHFFRVFLSLTKLQEDCFLAVIFSILTKTKILFFPLYYITFVSESITNPYKCSDFPNLY